MKAGQTNLDVGQRVRISGLKDKEETELNGLTGTVTHPFAFGCTSEGWIGVWLDAGCSKTPWGGQVNVREHEVELLNH